MATYPDWVNACRKPGTTVKMVGNCYYLYRTKSVRVPGKKNPQPQSVYLGIITPEGLVETGIQKVNTEVVRVYEYGFSYAMKALFPEKMVRDIGNSDRANGILLHLIRQFSTTSYLLRGVEAPTRESLGTCISTQLQKFIRLTGINPEELCPLQEIYLVEIGGLDRISEISDEQSTLLRRIGVRI